MKLKLDENIDVRLAPDIAEAGHDVETVLDEGFGGRTDEDIYRHCLEERRTIVSLDKDFASPIRFPPGPSAGIVVLRPSRPTLPLVRSILAEAIARLVGEDLAGKLWIVEFGRIRVYNPSEGRQ